MWFNSYECSEGDNHYNLFPGTKADIENNSVWLVSVLFGMCSYQTPEPIAENSQDVECGESSHPNKEEKTLVLN
jgi:hypothetical protein